MVLVISGLYQVRCKSYPKQEDLMITCKYAVIISTINNGMAIVTKNNIYKGNEIKLLKFLNIYLFMYSRCYNF